MVFSFFHQLIKVILFLRTRAPVYPLQFLSYYCVEVSTPRAGGGIPYDMGEDARRLA